MLAKLGQVVRKDLLVDLHDLAHKHVVKRVEGHDRVLRHQIAECHKRLVLVVHEQQKRRGHIRHPLYIPDVWSVHRKSLENAVKLCVVYALVLEYSTQFWEGARDVRVDYQDAALSRLSLSFLVLFRLNVNQHRKLFAQLEQVSVKILELFELFKPLSGVCFNARIS